jgi:hypothetical protein
MTLVIKHRDSKISTKFFSILIIIAHVSFEILKPFGAQGIIKLICRMNDLRKPDF